MSGCGCGGNTATVAAPAAATTTSGGTQTRTLAVQYQPCAKCHRVPWLWLVTAFVAGYFIARGGK